MIQDYISLLKLLVIMFSGIIEEKALVKHIVMHGQSGALTVTSSLDHTDTSLGDSISIDGVCLTVVKKEGSNISFDISFLIAQ